MVSAADSLNSFLNYDFDVSARVSHRALAVVRVKNESGQKEEALTIIDLKAASLWTKIKLWWHGSLKKGHIGSYMSNHVQHWSAQVAQDQATQVHFEKQCAKMSRKIRFTHNPVWTLNVKIRYPSADQKPEQPLQEQHHIIHFDRLTTNREILSQLDAISGQMSVNSKQLTPNLLDIFQKRVFRGDYNGEVSSNFLKDSETASDRSCEVEYSDLNRDKLMNYYNEALRQEGYQAGYNSGAKAGYQAGYNSGASTVYTPVYTPVYARPRPSNLALGLGVGLATGLAVGGLSHHHHHHRPHFGGGFHHHHHHGRRC